MSPRRIYATRKAQRPKDRLIELSPGVYMFEPAWAQKRKSR